MVRETKEELDIDIQQSELKYLGVSTILWNGRKIIRYMYLYTTDQKDFNVLEGKGAHWLTFEEARERLENEDRFDKIVKKIESVGA